MAFITGSFVADGQFTNYVLDTSQMESRVAGYPGFVSASDWKKVVLAYEISGSEQYINFTFRPREGSFVQWKSIHPDTDLGTWSVRNSYVTTWAGAVLSLDDSSFTSSDDIVITS